MTPKVSVIVPNYNHALYLRSCIDSISNQFFQDQRPTFSRSGIFYIFSNKKH